MRVRKLGTDLLADGTQSRDMVFGRGKLDYWKDVPDAVAQCVETRLGLNVGDWFLDLNAGTPWRTQVLGKFTGPLRDPAVKARILGTTGITKILTYYSTVDRDTRTFSAKVLVDTAYGQATVNTGDESVLATIDVRNGR